MNIISLVFLSLSLTNMETAIKKPSILDVQTLEETIYLLQESEKDIENNWTVDAKEAYLEGLKFINSLK